MGYPKPEAPAGAPPWWDEVVNAILAGVGNNGWPASDEYLLSELGLGWSRLEAEIGALHNDATLSVSQMLGGYGGEVGSAISERWGELDGQRGGLADIAARAAEAGLAAFTAANSVSAAKARLVAILNRAMMLISVRLASPEIWYDGILPGSVMHIVADIITTANQEATAVYANLVHEMGASHMVDAADAAGLTGPAVALRDALGVINRLNAGGEVPVADLERLGALLGLNYRDQQFAGGLYRALGPEGTLELLGRLSVPDDQLGGGGDERRSTAVGEVQRQLGELLALATDPTNEAHVDERWVTELMNLGGSTIDVGRPWEVSGYALLAPVLPHGRYHEDFLVPLVEHMIAIEASGGWNRVGGRDIPGRSSAPPAMLAYDNDPLNWALVALDNNPDAALSLFDGGGTGMEDIDGVDLNGVAPVADPFHYLIGRAGELRSPAEISPDLLGNALESATTGISTNVADPYATPPIHSPRMASLTDRLIDYVAAHPDEFTGGPKNQMIDNFGAITTAYIDDFHRALGSPNTDPWAINQQGADLFLRSSGNEDVARSWLRVVGHDQSATAGVWGASEGLLYGHLEEALGDDSRGVQAGEAFEMHGRLTGALTVGSLDAVANGVYQAAEDQNAIVTPFAEGAKYAAAVVVGHATANPWLAAAGGQAAGYAIEPLADFFRYTDDEVEHVLKDLVEGRIDSIKDDMRSREAHIEEFLRAYNDRNGAEPDLREEDIQTLVANYYERYWDPVANYAEQFTE